MAESEINQEQSTSRQALLTGTYHTTMRHQASRKRRRLNSPSPSPGETPSSLGNRAIQIENMGFDIMDVAREFAELQRCNAILTNDNANMKSNAPEGWIPPAEVSRQLEVQAEKHAVQLGALKTELTLRIEKIEAEKEELKIRLGKYKTAVDNMLSIN